jgi:hypothetical protein
VLRGEPSACEPDRCWRDRAPGFALGLDRSASVSSNVRPRLRANRRSLCSGAAACAPGPDARRDPLRATPSGRCSPDRAAGNGTYPKYAPFTGHGGGRTDRPAEEDFAAAPTGELWIADRNFCTAGLLEGIIQRGSCFVIRRHGNFTIASEGTLRQRGRCATGQLFEQNVTFIGEDGKAYNLRRIVVRLDRPTRDGDREIAILTNVPARDASAAKIAELYKDRWTLESLFQMLTQTLNGEIPQLGYPNAALFAFGVALVSYNVASVIRAALRAKHGHETVERETSSYYIANEVRATHFGMDVALDDEVWAPFQRMSAEELASRLLEYAEHARLSAFKKTPRGPKKPVPPRTRYTNVPHVSTARLLAEAGRRR